MNKRFRLFAFILIVVGLGQAMLAGPAGYFRQPSIHKNIVAFVAEGDLWTVSADGGDAVHLTNHPGTESTPAISPDGKTIAFIAHYEGPREVYTMPLSGGLPTRRTYDGESVAVVGWTRDNQILCSTMSQTTLPSVRLETLDISSPSIAAIAKFVPLRRPPTGVSTTAARSFSLPASHIREASPNDTGVERHRASGNLARATPRRRRSLPNTPAPAKIRCGGRDEFIMSAIPTAP